VNSTLNTNFNIATGSAGTGEREFSAMNKYNPFGNSNAESKHTIEDNFLINRSRLKIPKELLQAQK
jgi:hypothetical protein